MLDPLRAAIASAIDGARSEDGLRQSVAAAIAHVAGAQPIGDALFVPMILADMGGQLMVYGGESGRIKMANRPTSVPFLDKPWRQAIDEFVRRGVIRADELERLLRTYAERSVEARQLMLEHIQELVYARLETALEEGQTLREFAADLRSGAESLGITVDDPSYIQTVFRTNVQSAYGAGRFRALTDPEVIAERPYVQYRTAGDAFVRPSHAALDGKIFRADSSEWHAIAPPNGYNCRCSIVSLRAEDVEGETITERVPKDAQPDEGFNGPPTRFVDARLT